MVPHYTPDFARELGYVTTMVKPSTNSVGRKSITIQGRADFSKVVLNQIEEQTSEHGMPSIITGRGNSRNSSFVNVGHADGFKGRRSEPTPMKVTNNAAASDNQPGFTYCHFH
jgi:hypothetical protein